MSSKETSKFISLILRHKPEIIGVTLDEHGWADVEELIRGVNKTHPLTPESLEEIVRTDEKQRYSFNEDHTLIRANQGHSIPVDVEPEEVRPPECLYHGTGEKYTASIEKQGLLPKSRLYVHLSGDMETARKVGSRHGKPVVYQMLSGKMADNGFFFYRSVNGVWLTKVVPAEYLVKNGLPVNDENEIVPELRKRLSAGYEEEAMDAFISLHGWRAAERALFEILKDSSSTEAECAAAADLLWSAVLDDRDIDKEAAVGLLYYRLGDKNAPYANNTIWSIAAALYDLDYANSDFNPLKDDRILKKLASYGIQIP